MLFHLCGKSLEVTIALTAIEALAWIRPLMELFKAEFTGADALGFTDNKLEFEITFKLDGKGLDEARLVYQFLGILHERGVTVTDHVWDDGSKGPGQGTDWYVGDLRDGYGAQRMTRDEYVAALRNAS